MPGSRSTRWIVIALAMAAIGAWQPAWAQHGDPRPAEPAGPPQLSAPATLQQATPIPDLGYVHLTTEVLEELPHDETIYTQGLVLEGDTYYESGGYGRSIWGGTERPSSLRAVDLDSGQEHRLVELNTPLFAEGLALVEDRLYQITWKDRIAFVYDKESFILRDRFEYEGDGWGLCYDGERLVMSDGSDILDFRDPETFQVLDWVQVTIDGVGINNLNELECVDGMVYANVWKTEQILRIDPRTGRVTGIIEASGLKPPDTVVSSEAVLNGIAYDPRSQTFIITGKWWPKMFRVRFRPLDWAERVPTFLPMLSRGR